MASRILISGGTGFIGRNLIKLLKSEGYKVIVISRQPGDFVSWDQIRQNGIPSGVDTVVNLVGENVLNFMKRFNDSFKKTVYESRVDLTKLLANAIDAEPGRVSSLVSISGVGIYPVSESLINDEYSPTVASDFFSKLCVDWENAARLKDDKCKVANIRCGVVMGRDGGMVKDLMLPFKLGLGGPIGNGRQFLPWIHIDDLTSLILFCIKNKTTGKLNGVAPDAITNKQFSQAFAGSMSRPAFIPTPEFVFDIIFGKERATMVTRGQHVVPKRTLELGFKYKYPDINSACRSFQSN